MATLWQFVELVFSLPITWFWMLVFSLFYLWNCFTSVEEGTSKSIVRFGEYRKTLLAKAGYKLIGNGDLTKLKENEASPYPSFLGGLRWVGVLKPLGIDKIYVRTMKFVKALPDGNFEKRADENTDFFLTGTQYQYSLLFENAEDGDNLPLSGKMTMTAQIINPYKALFLVKDWFDALVLRVLPRVREYISEHTYNELINDKTVKLDEDVLKSLKDDSKGDSIVSILREQYGIELLALETVNIDPPPEYREATLKEYLAKQRVKVAKQEAEVEAEETGGALDLMVNRQIESTTRHYKLKKEEKKQIRQQCLNILLRDRASKSGGLKDVRIANADGSSFSHGSISEIVGGIVAAVAAATGAKESSGRGTPDRTDKKKEKKKPWERTDDEANEDYKNMTKK